MAENVESVIKRPRTKSLDTVDIYDSDDDSVQLDKVDSEIERSSSSYSFDESAEDSSGSSIVSEMDDINEDSSSIFFGKDKTRWCDNYDTTNFQSFDTFYPRIKDETCKDCVTPLGNYHSILDRNFQLHYLYQYGCHLLYVLIMYYQFSS